MISLDEQIKKDMKANRRRNEHQNNYHGNYKQRQNDYHQRHNQVSKTVLKIINLHYSVTKEQLQNICEEYGKVKMCRIEWDKMGRSNEKATVQYYEKDDAQQAAKELGKRQFEQQKMEVSLVNSERMPSRRYEIKKNYNSRYRQFNNNKYHKRK